MKNEWLVVSIFFPQLQIGFKQSWKLCLNLWSAKWLKPSLILVSNFKPWKFWVEEILFGMGLINFRTRLLIIWHGDELQILISMLFHLVVTAGRKEFFKKLVFTLKKGIWPLITLWEAYGLLLSSINLKRLPGDLLRNILQSKYNFLNHQLDFKVSNPSSWKSFSNHLSLMAPVIAVAALYCIDSRRWWNDSLKARSYITLP